MRTKYDNLRINSLTPEQKARTCGYWYTVTNNNTAHTAFQTREAALSWLRSLGLKIAEELAPEGEFQSQKIEGCYIRATIMTDKEGWEALPGIPTAALENGGYRPAKLDCVGNVKILYACNANNKWAKIYDYSLCRKMENQGISIF